MKWFCPNHFKWNCRICHPKKGKPLRSEIEGEKKGGTKGDVENILQEAKNAVPIKPESNNFANAHPTTLTLDSVSPVVNAVLKDENPDVIMETPPTLKSPVVSIQAPLTPVNQGVKIEASPTLENQGLNSVAPPPPDSQLINDMAPVTAAISSVDGVFSPSTPVPSLMKVESVVIDNVTSPAQECPVVNIQPPLDPLASIPVQHIHTLAEIIALLQQPQITTTNALSITNAEVTPSIPQNQNSDTPTDEHSAFLNNQNAIIDDEVVCEVFRDLGLGDDFLNSGQVLAWALLPDDPAFLNIHDYVANGQAHNFGIKVLSILRIIPQVNILDYSETPSSLLDFDIDTDNNDIPMSSGSKPSRMILWHGTSIENVASILANGFVLPELGNQMFGAGIYLADRISKSCQYCDGYDEGDIGYLLLCDVLLGRVFIAFSAKQGITKPPKEVFDSVKGIGRRHPFFVGEKTIDGCVWPLGKTWEYVPNRCSINLEFNEYIIYKTEQVIPKYLVRVEFTKQPYYEKIY